MKDEYLTFCSALIFINVTKANSHFRIGDMKTEAKYRKKAFSILAKMIYIDEYHIETEHMRKTLRVINVKDN